MIGVVAPEQDWPVWEEFFELFKTPWEQYQEGRSYEVVLVHADEVPEVEAPLTVVYGARPHPFDSRWKLRATPIQGRARLCLGEQRVPIHGPVATLESDRAGETVARLEKGSAPAGWLTGRAGDRCLRLGYDLVGEVTFLLREGQPVEDAATPTLDLHVEILRQGLRQAGAAFLEIPPTPDGYDFTACLTHDIDFVGIRRHCLDHTMWGFLYRATLGSLLNAVRGRLSAGRLLQNWWAAATLPAVYLGWKRDFWEPFQWYLEVERGLPATYFMIPFKGRAGKKLTSAHARRRACRYDIDDVANQMRQLREAGHELGVHGIDAWHDAELGRQERRRVARHAGEVPLGIRLHWLVRGPETFALLEEAGYSFDSTVGYNETIGYRAGTGQVFRPPGMRTLLELPMHIQDGALFYGGRLGWDERRAGEACGAMIEHARRHGGVLTLLWHDRSHAPERHWGGFYRDLVGRLKQGRTWFASAGQVVSWFRQRRSVRFERAVGGGVVVRHEGAGIDPPLTLRFHGDPGSTRRDIQWEGREAMTLNGGLPPARSSPHPAGVHARAEAADET